jgi:hypothetical protein
MPKQPRRSFTISPAAGAAGGRDPGPALDRSPRKPTRTWDDDDDEGFEDEDLRRCVAAAAALSPPSPPQDPKPRPARRRLGAELADAADAGRREPPGRRASAGAT